MTQKLRPPERSVSTTYARPRRHLGAWWFVAPLIAIAVYGGDTSLIFDRDELGGIAATADGGMVVGVTSAANFIRFRGFVVKTDRDGAILWRRILTARGDSLRVGGVAESLDGDILVSVRIGTAPFSCNPEQAGFFLYKLNQNGDSIWERRLELTSLQNKLFGELAPPIFVHSGGGVILNLASRLVMTDEEANVLWESDGVADAVTETKDGGIVAAGYIGNHLVARRLDGQGNLQWERELARLPSNYPGFVSMAESAEGNTLILTGIRRIRGGEVAIEIDGDEEVIFEDEVLIAIGVDGEVLEIQTNEALARPRSMTVTHNTEIVVSDNSGLIRLDEGGTELWRRESSSVGSGWDEQAILVETLNGDILVAKTQSRNARVTRVSGNGDILFTRSFDGEGNGGFIDE